MNCPSRCGVCPFPLCASSLRRVVYLPFLQPPTSPSLPRSRRCRRSSLFCRCRCCMPLIRPIRSNDTGSILTATLVLAAGQAVSGDCTSIPLHTPQPQCLLVALLRPGR